MLIKIWIKNPVKMKILFAILSFNILSHFSNLQAQTSNIVMKSKSAKTNVRTKSTTQVKPATIQFAVNEIDLGTIKGDAVIEKNFEFTNVGNTDLVIIDASGSCGCTMPVFPNTPIPPGGKNKITVKYTARNKVGPQKPLITVVTNGTPSVYKLQMEGWVEQIPGGVK